MRVQVNSVETTSNTFSQHRHACSFLIVCAHIYNTAWFADLVERNSMCDHGGKEIDSISERVCVCYSPLTRQEHRKRQPALFAYERETAPFMRFSHLRHYVCIAFASSCLSCCQTVSNVIFSHNTYEQMNSHTHTHTHTRNNNNNKMERKREMR